METETKKLFIYGTLLASAGHEMGQLLQRHGTSIGAGSIQARLYIVEEIFEGAPNRYPAAVPSAFVDDRVFGEVYEVLQPDTVFPAFDDYEACVPGWPEPYEFLRRPVDVTMDAGGVLRASSYLYTWDTSRAKPVPSGRFTDLASNTR